MSYATKKEIAKGLGTECECSVAGVCFACLASKGHDRAIDEHFARFSAVVAGRVAVIKQPCSACGAETKSKKACPACKAPVVYVAPSKKAKPPLESKIKAEVRAAVIASGCLCWVHNVDNRFLTTGLGLGTSDLICVVPPLGRFLGIEIKRPGYEPSRVSDNQRAWLAVVRQFGGVTGIATNVTEALALVYEARQESLIHVDPSRT